MQANYALIHVLDPARAAQYSALVEQHQLQSARAASEEEARFHAQRRGQASLIIAEVRQSPDGFDLLRRLRKGRRPQLAPALLISGSMKVRDEALRLRKQLNIAEVLTASQPLSTIDAAVVRAMQKAPRKEIQLVQHLPPPKKLDVHELLEQAARQLGAGMALASTGTRLRGWFGWDKSLVSMIGEPEDWTPFRDLASIAALHVPDASRDAVLSSSPLTATGTVRSFAGTPVCDEQGKQVGALWLTDDRAGRFDESTLESLGVWAQKLGAISELEQKYEALTSLQLPMQPEETFKPSAVSANEAMEQLLAHSSDGFVATDLEDRIAFANPAASRLIGLRSRRLQGTTRARMLDLMCKQAGLDPRTARTLAAGTSQPMIVTLLRPHRILRWETKVIPLGTAMGKMDQLVDVTAELDRRETNARLARIDPLTWLSNARGFDDAMAREIARALRHKTPLTLALFRVDGREQLEEADSEQILREVAWPIAEISRGYDQAARLEDDTLALILPGTEVPGAQKLAARITEELESLRTQRARKVSAAVGIAQFDPKEDVAQTVARAHAAMLQHASREPAPLL